jgi:hypothetical protein
MAARKTVPLMDLMLRLSTRPTRLLRLFAKDKLLENVVRRPRKTDWEKVRKLYVVVSGPAPAERQRRRAERFLRKYREPLSAYVRAGHRAMLDFGVATEEIGFYKNIYLPTSFTLLAAEVGVNLNITVYSPS